MVTNVGSHFIAAVSVELARLLFRSCVGPQQKKKPTISHAYATLLALQQQGNVVKLARHSLLL